MADGSYDLAIIGGGINGAGVARDAAGRGLKVVLCEQGDLAGATSSASTKLIHGGLRYLEHYEFRLVREALAERELLLRAAPHIIRPMRFVLPHHAGLRPVWLIRLGLFLYDHLGGREILPATRSVDLRTDPVGACLKPDYVKAFEYSDCWVEDARLVVLNAIDAAERGAEIKVRMRVVTAERQRGLWALEAEDAETGRRHTFRARALVNAAGPWVPDVIKRVIHASNGERARLVKGSHIVTRRLQPHDKAYIFQNSDGRIVFAIPYEHDFTLIGTTDVDYDGDPAAVAICDDEIDYLCGAVNAYFKTAVSRDDIVNTFAGVRPLFDDGTPEAQAATRDYVLTLDGGDHDMAPFVSIFGGKITTYRRLAEAVMAKLEPFFPDLAKPWTANASLPGGDFPLDGIEALADRTMAGAPGIGRALALRLVRAYGTGAPGIVAGIKDKAGLGRHFGADLYEREVDYLMQREWARTAEDVLWRRSKLGLRLSPGEAEALNSWMAARAAHLHEPAA